MTDVLHFPSPQSTNTSSSKPVLSYAPQTSLTCAHGERNDFVNAITSSDPEGEEEDEDEEEEEELSLLALVVTLFRKSLAACKSMERRELCAMEIGWPTNVRHVAHVTFDRFNGFLGLPVEFEPEVPRRAPSASTTVFGVSTESMQLSYDSRGNIVPTILLLMQRRLYAQGGLQAEGIFRINAENSQEEYVREQLNGGVVPEGIDVHCLAGLIKAWFRELPRGVLDSLSPEQVMECQTEEQCAELARFIPPTEFALLDWAINLMADVVQQQHLNKMNARNIAMVFAPNMTQMADPLNALMYAVQVMNFLKTLIVRTLREREDSVVEPAAAVHLEPFDDNGDQSPSISCIQDTGEDNEEKELSFIAEEALSESFRKYSLNNEMKNEDHSSTPTVKGLVPDADHSDETAAAVETFMNETDAIVANCLKPGTLANTQITNLDGKTREISNLSCFIKDMRFPLESKIFTNSSAGSCILSVDTFSVNAPVVEVELLSLASVTLPPEPESGFSGLGPLRASFSNLSCSIFLMKTFSAALSSSLSIFPVPLVKNLRDMYLKPILVAIVVDYNIEQLKL